MITARSLLAIAILAGLAACGDRENSPDDRDEAVPPVSESPVEESVDVSPESGTGEPGPAVSETGDCQTLSAAGLCGVSFGMTPEEASEAYAEGDLDTIGEGVPEGVDCYYIGPEQDNYDLGLMIVKGTVQRIDVRSDAVRTPEGAGVGTPSEEVGSLYENMQRQPNKYVPELDNLIVDLEGDARLIMETDETGAVRAWRIGLPPAVNYVEGCS